MGEPDLSDTLLGAPRADPTTDPRWDIDDTVVPSRSGGAASAVPDGDLSKTSRLAGAEPVAVESPSGVTRALALVSISGGAPIEVTDYPIVIGRDPRPARVPVPIEPRLVRVESAHAEVSRSHLEIRRHGASVIVTDLRSTNGTIVRMPGTDPFSLRPGDSCVAAPGTLIDIGDGNIVDVLPVRHHPVDHTPLLASGISERPTP